MSTQGADLERQAAADRNALRLRVEDLTRALDRLQFAAAVVVREAESVHYMGRMEVSVEAIHALRRAAQIDGRDVAE